ncbi:FAD:protein FMN transferase [Paenibacillus qinlingensis]|uniref:FAD:protein FMN transferase n=1 Tax=Paenibacillus qinlingensis TaxID=1837343 RepID=UPI00156320B8|nr:FAD:protein FMN transferase [Paenibacillus qinlingensis]NQX62399.1 FAD:protein FMN transferase [Paenibacillus qinlingensis]
MTMKPNTFLPFHFQTLDSAIELLLPHGEQRQQLQIHEIGNEWFGREEKRFSLSLPDSEINLLNTLAGESCLVSNAMLEVLFLAEMYQAITDGKYTPLLYKEKTTLTHMPAPAIQGWRVNPATKSVTLPEHTCIHLQGLDKSWSLKRLTDYLKRTLSISRGRLLSQGDVTVWGPSSAEQEPWMIGIQNPWHENAKLGAIVMPEGALSTYSPLEDLSDGDAGSDVLQCTVVGGDLVACHVWARLLGSLGLDAGLSLLAKRSDDCEAIVLTKHDELHYYGREASLGHRWLDLQVDHYHFIVDGHGRQGVDSFT